MIWPFVTAAVLALVAAGLIAGNLGGPRRRAVRARSEDGGAHSLAAVLLGLSFITALAVGVFEVGISLRSGRLAKVTPSELAVMFSVCSLVMFAAQAILFSPLVRAERTWRILAPGFVVMAVALFLAFAMTSFGPALAVVALLAASAGAVSPTLAYWLSVSTGADQGMQLGKQTAASSLGQALGSAAGGLLLNTRVAGADPFLLAAVIALAGGFAALLLSPRLAAMSVSAAAGRETAI
jgi:predicted MFS family arabinose efflux permease